MPTRTKLLVSSTILCALGVAIWAAKLRSRSWVEFGIFLGAILLSSGFKVPLPRGDGTMSLNFPFILLSLVMLSPLQAMILAGLSVAAQCRIRVINRFSSVQIAFNIANSMVATALAWLAYDGLVHIHVALPPALAAASVAYFFCNTGLVACVIASSKGERVIPLWKAEFPWYLPFYFVGAVLAAMAHLTSVRFGWASSVLLIPLVYTVYRSYTAQITRIKERQQHLEETEALHLRTIEGLAMAIEAKDQGTHDHLLRVRRYVAELGRAMKLDQVEMQALQTAALLHDIGKLAVPEHIINKPGKLTPEEFEKMKIHPVVGADILERVRFPYPVVPIVRSHHEWWNGKGYPDGLEGEQIPIGARVLTVVDCFDALVSDRPYRKALPAEDAMAMVRKLAGTQFDPAVVAALELHYAHLEEQAAHEPEEHFVALNTEVEVSRGRAPGAGFEHDSESRSQAKQPEAVLGVCKASPAHGLASHAAAGPEAEALFEMSLSLANSLSLDETISMIAVRLHELISFDCAALYEKCGDAVVARYVDGDHAKLFSAQPIPMGEGISGWVAQSGKPILNGNAAVEPSYRRKPGSSAELKAAMSIPLLDPQNEIFGVLTLYAVKPDSFSRDDLRVLRGLEAKLSLSLQKALNSRSPKPDPETKVPNAKGLFVELEAELNRCMRRGGRLALVVCNLHSIDQVNDLGAVTGNMLLSSVVEELRRSCRPYDTVARRDRDEFVFVLPDMDAENLDERLRSIADTVQSAFRKLDLETIILPRLGAAFYPADAKTGEELLAVADRRMMYGETQVHYGFSATPLRQQREQGLAV